MIDYKAVGLKAGLEIHQQLSTHTKLFCKCPTEIRKRRTRTSNFSDTYEPGRASLAKWTAQRRSRP